MVDTLTRICYFTKSFICLDGSVVKHSPRAGLADLSSFHHVTPSLPRLDKLLGQGFPPEAATLALQLSNNDHSEAVALMEGTRLQDLMTYRLVLSPRSSEGAVSPNRRARFKSISVVSPVGSMVDTEQVSEQVCRLNCLYGLDSRACVMGVMLMFLFLVFLLDLRWVYRGHSPESPPPPLPSSFPPASRNPIYTNAVQLLPLTPYPHYCCIVIA